MRWFARLILLILALSLALTGSAHAAVPATRALPGAIEPLAPYQEQTACDPYTRAGTAALVRLLTATYRGTTAATTYACGTDGTRSEHYDGRAIDWMVNVRNAGQRAAATAFLGWLLATDRAGNRFAMARRLGVMYVIFDNRMWGAWDGRWEDYNGCSRRPQRAQDNACHRTHVHISLDWNGATGRTTYWSGRVSPTDFGPCRRAGLNWAGRYWHPSLSPCPGLSLYRAAKGSSATKIALVRYSGVAVHAGSSGPAVSAVQRALRVRVSGRYDAATAAAIRAFQSRHRLPASGQTDEQTWLTLLPTVR